MFEKICEAVVIIDLNGNIVKVTKCFNDMFGYEGKELIGNNINIIIPEPYKSNHPEYLKKYMEKGVGKFINCIRNVVCVKKDGSYKPTEMSISRITDDRIVGIFRNFGLLNKMVDGILIILSSGQIITANNEITKIFGYEMNMIVDKRIDDLIPSITCKDDKKGKNFFDEFEGININGESIPLEVSLSNISQDIYILTIKDISEKKSFIKSQKEMEGNNEKLKYAINQANIATEAKTAFLANMSHEIRTPMNGIYGMLSLLTETNLDNTQKDYVLTCIRSAESLMSILDDILLFSKSESGKIELENTAFNLADIIEDVVCVMSGNIAKEKDIDLVYFINQDVPINLIGDPSRLRQILMNMLSNGIKFTQIGEVALEVSLHKKNPLIIKFDINDTGIGMSKEQMKKLFKPFSQADASTTRKYGGTGLGLAICKELVNLFKGDINVTSRLGRGSTFTFTAKFERNLDVEIEDLDERKVKILKNKKILIIDDNAVNCLLLQSILVRIGCKVHTVRCGLQGIDEIQLARLKDDPYEILILDYHMPNIDGIQVAQILEKKGFDNLKILMISSSMDQQKIFKESNITLFLSKPIKKNHLINTVCNMIKTTKNDMILVNSIERTDSYVSLIKKEKIMIVEDNFINRQVLGSMLNKLGYCTIEVKNGLEAVELVDKDVEKNNGKKDKKIDNIKMIIMDIHMPVMDGLQATHIMREKGIDIPIIALTADISQNLKEMCKQVGFDSFITKPVSLKILSKEINGLIDENKEQKITIKIDINSDVLVVDDIDTNLKVFKSYFDKMGCKCHLAKNGQDGLNILLNNDNIGLLFVDIHMPIMNGFQMIEELKNLGVKIPTIVISASGKHKDVEKLNEMGVNDYLEKPIKYEDLFKITAENQSSEVIINKIFNYDTFHGLVDGNHELSKMLHNEYHKQIEETIIKIEKYIDEKNHKKIKIEGHTLKGASYQIGYELFGYLSHSMEEASENEDLYKENLILDLVKKYYYYYRENEEFIAPKKS